MSLSTLVTAIPIVAFSAAVIAVVGLFTSIPIEEEYEGGEGDQVWPPPEESYDEDDEEIVKPPPEDPCGPGTKPLGCDCSSTGQCSATGLKGGRESVTGIFRDRVSCDRGRCEYDRKDWADAWYPPSECVGKLFGQKGTCSKISPEESEIRKRLGWG